MLNNRRTWIDVVRQLVLQNLSNQVIYSTGILKSQSRYVGQMVPPKQDNKTT